MLSGSVSNGISCPLSITAALDVQTDTSFFEPAIGCKQGNKVVLTKFVLMLALLLKCLVARQSITQQRNSNNMKSSPSSVSTALDPYGHRLGVLEQDF